MHGYIFSRPQVPRGIAGTLLGEAAHRLVKNTLNIRPNGSSSRYFEQTPYRNISGNPTVNRPRPAGPSGHERGYNEDPNYYYGHYNNQQATSNPGFPPISNGMPANRHNFKTQDRVQYPEQYHDIRTGVSALTVEENVRTRPPVVMLQRMPNTGNNSNMHISMPKKNPTMQGQVTICTAGVAFLLVPPAGVF